MAQALRARRLESVLWRLELNGPYRWPLFEIRLLALFTLTAIGPGESSPRAAHGVAILGGLLGGVRCSHSARRRLLL